MIRSRSGPFITTALSAALLCACDKVPNAQDAQGPQSVPVAAADVGAAAPASSRTQLALDPLQGCDETLLDEATDRGRILVATCPTASEAEIRFVHKDGANVRVGAFKMDSVAYSAVTDANAKLWDKNVVSVDLARERGGTLVVADWNGADFVVSQVPYRTGDEESLGLEYRNAAFVLSTEANGQERLTQVTEGEDKGRYRRESVACRADAKGKFSQSLELTINAAGRVNALAYIGLTPQDTGAFSCSIDADRADGESVWTDENGETVVAFQGDGEDDEPNRIRIRSAKGLYTVDFEVKVSGFCGQSSVSATQIVLQSGEKTCKSVEVTD